ncbi:thioredoxin domain-containing protein [Persephonella sp.]
MANRLINEKSPYLKQHAHNPVDWYPWCDEAFERAKKEDKPVFLSIGYSTCHWCHVMEKESFEDREIAQILNRHFISIKVDREERPDIDSLYMNVCMMMTGRGGWPLTIFMTPDKKPFYAGTYFPKEGSYTRIGLKELLLNIAKLWKEDREKLIKRADTVIQHLEENSRPATGKINKDLSGMLYEKLKDSFDPYHGGFGRRPKFPVPHNHLFLLRYFFKTGKENSLSMVVHTLERMRTGGIYDHVGYGFHRYSTDERWFLPHFEKMLYDQAMLIMAYTEGYRITGKRLFKHTVSQTVEYLTGRMLSPEGGFYSAEDADSEGEEGKYYVWDYSELERLLGGEFGLFKKVYDITPEGNYREEHTGKPTGKNILHMKATPEELANQLDITEDRLYSLMEKWRGVLLREREKRVPPLKDTKILTDWNGLVIAALSTASSIDKKYLGLAGKTVDFILMNMKKSDGTLLHRYKDGVSEIEGFLTDYAYFIWGLIELYQKSFENRYLLEAIKLTETVITHFYDPEGGFFETPDFGEKLPVRPKEYYDGALPSGNSVMTYNLMRLFRITGRLEYRDAAIKTVESIAGKLTSIPHGYSMMVLAWDFFNHGGKDVVISGRDISRAVDRIAHIYNPYMTVVAKKDYSLDDYLPHLKSIPVGDEPKIYICENFSCNYPITDLSQIDEMLINS